MTINRKAMNQLRDCLELLKCGRAHQARYLLEVTIEAIERKPRREEQKRGEAA
jgi:hypothetical protein